jgi:hypothetical protein
MTDSDKWLQLRDRWQARNKWADNQKDSVVCFIYYLRTTFQFPSLIKESDPQSSADEPPSHSEICPEKKSPATRLYPGRTFHYIGEVAIRPVPGSDGRLEVRLQGSPQPSPE